MKFIFKIAFLVFVLKSLAFFVCAHSACSDCSNIVFIENKNQWNSDVEFKANISSGTALFVEKNALTFNLVDMQKLNAIRSHGHGNRDCPEAEDPIINCHAYQIRFLNSNSSEQWEAMDREEGYYNFYKGNDPSKWAAKVGGFYKIKHQNIYNEIDLELYSQNGLLKYDFVIKAGANPSDIVLKYKGTDGLFTSDGNLFIKTSLINIQENKPLAFQLINGKRKVVKCEFDLRDDMISFNFPDGFDDKYDLIIDPSIIFSTFSGSFADNFGYTATFDSDGNAYAGGSVFDNGYPTTLGAFQTTWAGGTGTGGILGSDMGITKYSADGSSRLYSTYIGGNSDELPHSFIVNSNDELFVFGTTSSPNFPTTQNAFDQSYAGGPGTGVLPGLGVNYINGSDIVVFRFNNDGTALLASTFLGGNLNDGLNTSGFLKYNYADEVRGEILIDENNNIYVVSCSYSVDFPVSPAAFQNNHNGGLDATIVKMDNNLTTIIWSSFYGGAGDDAAYSIALDADNNAYVTGGTTSLNLFTTNGVLSNVYNGGRSDAFVAHVSENGQTILNATYYGSQNYDQAYFVETDGENNVFLLGQTEATGNAFIFNAIYNSPNSGQFISKIRPTLDALVWSTTFGNGTGIPDISPTAFLVDVCNKVYVSGWGGAVNGFGGTTGLDITGDALQNSTDNSDFYLLVLKDDASAIDYGSYFGGPLSPEHVDGGTSRFDRNGVIYQSVCAGCGGNSDFPIFPSPNDVVSATNNSPNCNNGIFKFDFQLPIVLADFAVPPVGCAPFTVQFTNNSLQLDSTTFEWDFGDGDTSSDENPTHVFQQPGIYTVKLLVSDGESCNGIDSVKRTVVILSNSRDTLQSIFVCDVGNVQIGLPPTGDPNITYSWSPATGLSETDIPNPIANVTGVTAYTLLISNGLCTDTLDQNISISLDTLNAIALDTGNCGNDTVRLLVTHTNVSVPLNYTWSPSSNIVSGDSTENPSVLVSQPTVFTVIGTNDLGCSYTDSVLVTVLSNDIVIGAPFENICIGDSVQLSVEGINPDDIFLFDWSPDNLIISGDSSPFPLAMPDTTATFIVEATDTFGCKYEDSTRVIVLSNSNFVLDEIEVCDTYGVEIGPSNLDPDLTFSWTPATGLSQTDIPNPTASSSETQTYTLTVSNGDCSDTFQQTVNFLSNAIEALGENLICIEDTIQLSASSLNPLDTLSYSWSPLEFIISGSNENLALANPDETTTFVVTAINESGCVYIDSIRVEVSVTDPLLVASADPDTIEQGGSSNLFADSDDAISYYWSPAIGLSASNVSNPVANPEETTTYFVTVQDSFGCEKTDSITVFIATQLCGAPYIYVPNAFTPNDDGKNDILYVRGENILELHLIIYDRWGEKVFEAKDLNVGWTGIYKDKKLDPAVFAYYLEATCDNSETLIQKGNITLLR